MSACCPVNLFESSYLVMLIIEPAGGRIVDANPAAERFYGWPRERLREMRISDINTLDEAEVCRMMNDAREARRNTFHFQHRTATGELRDVQVSSGRIEHEGRELLYSIIHDASAHLAALRALEQSEYRFQQLIEAAPDAMFIHCDMELAFANRQTARLFGISDEKNLIGRPVLDFVHPDFHDLARERISEMSRSGDGAPAVEVDLITAEGRLVHAEVSSVPIEHEGRPAFLVIARDITQRRQGLQRLRLASTVFENTSEGIIITDGDSRIVGVNRAFSRITGYSEADVVGKNPRLLRSNRHGRDFYRKLWQELAQKGRWQGEMWNRRKDGSVYPQLTRINAVSDERGQLSRYVAVITDLSDLHDSRAKIEQLYYRDLLTGLPNRVMFSSRLATAMSEARHRQRLYVLHIDLDGFKHVNESLGLQTGDRVLKEVARRLKAQLSDPHLVARIGADEFAALLRHEPDVEGRAQAILETLSEPISIQERVIFTSASIGIAAAHPGECDPEELLQRSDAASHRAQAEGGNLFRYYEEEIGVYARDRVLLAAQLRQAITRDELTLHYQPQVDVGSQRVAGLEALVRWQHPELGFLQPDRFIPIAEDTGLIVELGEWVLFEACRQARQWIDDGVDFEQVSVNVSGIQVQRSDLRAVVERALTAFELPANRLELELTESLVMGTGRTTIDLLEGLRSLGVAIAIDDFGTGYSSLAYLKKLPFDTIKIDRSFTQHIEIDERDAAICQAITGLGGALGFRVLAEGVETADQQQRLLAMGCRLAQGFLFDPALPAEDVPDSIARINKPRVLI